MTVPPVPTAAPRYVLSLGVGVQSTTLYLMATRGEIPPFDVAVFADTQGEPRYVYDHLERLKSYAEGQSIPIVQVTAGSLAADTFTKKSVSPPYWIKKSNGGEGGPGFRGCTDKYKVRPIDKWLRAYADVPRGCKDTRVNLAIGISTDESLRAKNSPQPWINHVHPLLDLGMSRDDCTDYLTRTGWGDTPKSACVFCPYHSDELWAEVKALDPEGWADSVKFDAAIREGTRNEDEGGKSYFLHRQLVPLDRAQLPVYVPGAAGEGVGCSPFSCPGDTIASQPVSED